MSNPILFYVFFFIGVALMILGEVPFVIKVMRVYWPNPGFLKEKWRWYNFLWIAVFVAGVAFIWNSRAFL